MLQARRDESIRKLNEDIRRIENSAGSPQTQMSNRPGDNIRAMSPQEKEENLRMLGLKGDPSNGRMHKKKVSVTAVQVKKNLDNS